DDIIFGATNQDLCKSFEKLMKENFQMSSIGELTFFLGLHVKQKEDGIFINQNKYVAEILKKAIGTKWVYKNKKDESGIVVRNKARLVAQGHTQEERIDYKEVFALVARIEAIRLFLAYASFMGFMVYQMYVKSAFLYGTIKEEVYVCQLPGFEDLDHPDKVYKVVKALYGLHQAPRAWNETLATYLLENSFHRGQIDQTLFNKKQKGDILLVQIYVDDIIFGATNQDLCKSFEKLMKENFQMSSMGELTFFLGLHQHHIYVYNTEKQVTIQTPIGFPWCSLRCSPGARRVNRFWLFESRYLPAGSSLGSEPNSSSRLSSSIGFAAFHSVAVVMVVVENIVVEYFLDSQNFGSRKEDTVVMVVVVDDDTPIVIDKLVRVTFAFQKEDTVARKNLSFVNMR
nr:putative ribonuclease H-like domain-containing protein [Tanacetum cinerariifolium]